MGRQVSGHRAHLGIVILPYVGPGPVLLIPRDNPLLHLDAARSHKEALKLPTRCRVLRYSFGWKINLSARGVAICRQQSEPDEALSEWCRIFLQLSNLWQKTFAVSG